MDKQEIEIRVDREGNVTLHVIGVNGDDCVRITESIEHALGTVTDRTISSEFYQEQEMICTNVKSAKMDNLSF